MMKDLEMGVVMLDYGGQCNHRVPVKGRQEEQLQGDWQMSGCQLRRWRRGREPRNAGSPPEADKGKETDSPLKPPEGPALPTPGF